MPPSSAVYHPLNGREVREILKKDICRKIDLIPMLKEGNAFDEASLAYSFTMTCVPADCPVPTAEWEVVARKPEVLQLETYTDKKSKAKYLNDLREQLENQIEKIENLLSGLEQVHEEEVIIQAGKTPDQVRIDHELPVPRIVKNTDESGTITSMSERYVNYNEL